GDLVAGHHGRGDHQGVRAGDPGGDDQQPRDEDYTPVFPACHRRILQIPSGLRIAPGGRDPQRGALHHDAGLRGAGPLRQMAEGLTVKPTSAMASTRLRTEAFSGSWLTITRPEANFTSADSTPSSPLSLVSIFSTQLGQENSLDRRVVLLREAEPLIVVNS